jgi:hypothetical protein
VLPKINKIFTLEGRYEKLDVVFQI